jgi:non-homologous end joining protein Ku
VLAPPDPRTEDRMRLGPLTAGTCEKVSRCDLVKGYEIAKNEYVRQQLADRYRISPRNVTYAIDGMRTIC